MFEHNTTLISSVYVYLIPMLHNSNGKNYEIPKN
jgi:hypothetical protein